MPVAVTSADQARDRICTLASSKESFGNSIHLINAYTIALADRSSEYFHILNSSTVNLPDGKPLSWFGRIGEKSFHQVRGPGLFEGILDKGRELGLRHYLLGSTEENLNTLSLVIQKRFPGALIVGSFSPPFRPMTQDEVADQDARIRSSKADIVWVGLGTPKQDFEVHRLAASLPITAIAVGAAFDFLSGSKREAPMVLSKIGLEWLFRLCSEPRRLWKRYLFGNILFVRALLRHLTRSRSVEK